MIRKSIVYLLVVFIILSNSFFVVFAEEDALNNESTQAKQENVQSDNFLQNSETLTNDDKTKNSEVSSDNNETNDSDDTDTNNIEQNEDELRIEEPTKGFIPKVDEVTDGDDDVFVVNPKYMTMMVDSATYYMEKTNSGSIQVGYRFTVTSGTGKGAIGTCVDPWGSIDDETVTGTAYKISNSTRTARLAYYIFKQGWDPGDAATYSGVWRGMAIHRSLATARVDDQIYTSKTREELWDKFYSMGANSNSYEVAMDLYSTALNTYSASAVPNSFEVYFLDTPGNRQDSIAWRQAPEGSLKVSKTVTGGSSAPTFTFHITVSGVNGTYSGVTFSNGKATITLKHGQSKTISGLPGGASYSVTEDSLIGWKLASSSGTSGSIPAGSTASASFTNEMKYVDIGINKSIRNTNITNNNALYSVSGTTFYLYKTQADARNHTNPITSFTIGNNGKSQTRSVQEGYYYITETQAGPGLLIPSSLQRSNGGVYVDGTSSHTITI